MIPRDYISEWREHAPWIGKTVDAIRTVLDTWLGSPNHERKENSFKLMYRFQSEEQPPKGMRLKIEINSREHFTEHGHVEHYFKVSSRWWSGEANITTFSLEELLGTKLRALFQRRKGRDLFDLWYALEKGSANPEKILLCFHRYMRESGNKIARGDFERNLAAKLQDELFQADITPLLRGGLDWRVEEAARVVSERLLAGL